MRVNHNFYLNLAFYLAEKNVGKTGKNPSVGCLVVKNNAVISSATTSINGRPHAEFNALNKNINFENSYLYVTLEPCTHTGNTPPCTDIIKRKKIRKVFYSFNDPDTRTNRKAKKILKQISKINTVNKKFKNFYKSYYLNQEFKFPLVDAKIAISKDLYTINKKSKWITNYRSRQVAHLIRSKYDCIISTSTTINKDNSLLNCRIDGLNNNKPDLIIIDRRLRLKKNLRLFNLLNKRKIYIFTTSNDNKRILYFRKKKIKIIKIDNLENENDFKSLFNKIFKIGKRRILIETGLKFLNQLLKFELINNFYLFKSNISLQKNGLNKFNTNYIKRWNLKKREKVNLGNDELLKIEIK